MSVLLWCSDTLNLNTQSRCQPFLHVIIIQVNWNGSFFFKAHIGINCGCNGEKRHRQLTILPSLNRHQSASEVSLQLGLAQISPGH